MFHICILCKQIKGVHFSYIVFSYIAPSGERNSVDERKSHIAFSLETSDSDRLTEATINKQKGGLTVCFKLTETETEMSVN